MWKMSQILPAFFEGFIVACFLGSYLTDVITTPQCDTIPGAACRVSFPRPWLVSFDPWMLRFAPAGYVVIVFTCTRKIHLVSAMFGIGMVRVFRSLIDSVNSQCVLRGVCMQPFSCQWPYRGLILRHSLPLKIPGAELLVSWLRKG